MGDGTWKHFKISLMHACIGAVSFPKSVRGLVTRIQCTRWISCVRVCLRGVGVCVFYYPAARFLTSLLSSGLSEEQSFLSVSQSVFGEMIVGF